jgi:hypothetical protein
MAAVMIRIDRTMSVSKCTSELPTFIVELASSCWSCRCCREVVRDSDTRRSEPEGEMSCLSSSTLP